MSNLTAAPWWPSEVSMHLTVLMILLSSVIGCTLRDWHEDQLPPPPLVQASPAPLPALPPASEPVITPIVFTPVPEELPGPPVAPPPEPKRTPKGSRRPTRPADAALRVIEEAHQAAYVYPTARGYHGDKAE